MNNKNRVLLINPETPELKDKEYVSTEIPTNLLYIAAALEQVGAEVKVIDFCTEKFEKEKLLSFLDDFGPGMVGITSMTASILFAETLAKIVKEHDKNTLIVLGGCHISSLPELTLKETPEIDIGVIGEGEETIKEIFKLKTSGLPLNNVKGTVYRVNKKIKINPRRELIKNLDSIAFPARHLIDIKKYERGHVCRGISRKNLKVMELIVSRGCPNRCIFCAGHINYGFSVRLRSFENIIAEINSLIEAYKINHVYIEDDLFTIKRELVIQLCNYFKEKKLTWNCNSRVDTIDFELIKLMKKSGCIKISFGVESGSPRILKLIKKNISLDKVREVFKLANDVGIKYVEGTFMLGSHPDETLEDIEMTRKLIFELLPDFISLSIMCPFPGTEVYDLMIKEGLLEKNPDWSKFVFIDKLPYERLLHLNGEQLLNIQEKILKNYHTSPKYLIKQILKIRSPGELFYFLHLGSVFISRFIIKTNKNL